MAMADYHLCDNCGRKSFYDASLDFYCTEEPDWLMVPVGAGVVKALCMECSKTHELRVVTKENLSE